MPETRTHKEKAAQAAEKERRERRGDADGENASLDPIGEEAAAKAAAALAVEAIAALENNTAEAEKLLQKIPAEQRGGTRASAKLLTEASDGALNICDATAFCIQEGLDQTSDLADVMCSGGVGGV